MSRLNVTHRARWSRAAGGFALAILLLSGCSTTPSKDKLFGAGWAADAGMQEVQEGDGGLTSAPRLSTECRQAVSSEALPAREAVMSAKASSGGGRRGVTVADLYGKFVDNCGRCHTNGRNQGGFDVSLPSFASRVNAASLQRMRSDDATQGMPQPFKAFSQRSKSDPIVTFAAELEEWLAAGSPEVFFPSTVQAGGGGGASPYLLSRKVGMELSNVGNCIPNAAMASNDSEQGAQLDQQFANMQRFEDLPKTLRETDLVTLDSAELARHGVFAFAPAYTLWADYAKKLRHVRVPRGESVRFDEDAQSFEIPANTRFYKTFFKPVTDLDGNVRYRKLETRIIVSRPDKELADGSAEPAALFGTYKWNEDETEAKLNEEPYTSDNTGFKDDIFTYVVDERLEDKLLGEGKKADALLEAGARRNYAIPGSDRCVHCHMGAPNKSFILGFTPVQVRRRPKGEGGVYEEAAQDELNQLERLIEYGVISNLASPEKVLPLEQSQGAREPRNAHELTAQGYILGNCAHCHNPRGFPSVREKVLADVLDFWPSEKGGIFQFPLDKFSPRSFRGAAQDIRIPYITPSLFDVLPSPESVAGTAKKWIVPASPTSAHNLALDEVKSVLGAADFVRKDALSNYFGAGRPLFAPWRSLIYRNVDAPASYEDGGAIFPHMPMDTPGYDCRARRLLGNWMVSVPARYLGQTAPPQLADYAEALDELEQPYVEATPSDTRYARYLAQAEERLRRFQASERYNDCPSPELDVVAPEVATGRTVSPAPQVTTLHPELGDRAEMYTLQSPARPHYTRTDLHDDLAWIQRRSDWYNVLVRDKVDADRRDVGGEAATSSAEAIKVVNTVRVSDAARAWALDPIPFGLWKANEACATKLAAQPKAGDFTGEKRPDWMDKVAAEPQAPVYMISRGAQVFSAVCAKCHGPQADGVSALANTMADLTGGKTRVANLRDGLFGPRSEPGANRRAAFALAAGAGGATVEDWVARYVAWMGLGGTNASIPQTVLAQIGSASVLGEKRLENFANVSGSADAANMLTVVKKACAMFAPADTRLRVFDVARGRIANFDPARPTDEKAGLAGFGLVAKNGDAELWRTICEFENPRFVTPVRFLAGSGFNVQRAASGALQFIRRESYPENSPVGEPGGGVATQIAPTNLAPWCVYAHNTLSESALAEEETRLGKKLPRCPEAFIERADQNTPNGDVTDLERSEWAARGAANAGMAVFLYLDALAKGQVKPVPAYDRCEELP